MGNAESKFDELQNLPLNEYTHVEKETKDARYGDYSLYIHKQDENKQIAVVSKIFPSDNSNQGVLKQLEELKIVCDSPFLVRIHFVEKKEKTEFCSNYSKISTGLDYFPFTLESEFEIRKKKKVLFSEDELWIIQHKYIHALRDLERKGSAHLNLSPEKLMIGRFGVGKVFYSHPFESGDYKNMHSEIDCIYHSPAMFISIIHGDVPIHNPEKSDIFSVGQILLQFATQKNSKSIYNSENGELDYTEIETRIEAVKERFSPKFLGNLRSMLNQNENNRPTIDSLMKNNPIHDGDLFTYIDWVIYKEENTKTNMTYRNTRRSMESDLDVQQRKAIMESPSPQMTPSNNVSAQKVFTQGPTTEERQIIFPNSSFTPLKSEPNPVNSRSLTPKTLRQSHTPNLKLGVNPKGPNLAGSRVERISPKPMESENEPSFIESEYNQSYANRNQLRNSYGASGFNRTSQSSNNQTNRYLPPPQRQINIYQSPRKETFGDDLQNNNQIYQNPSPFRYSKVNPEVEAILQELREKNKNRSTNLMLGETRLLSTDRLNSIDFKTSPRRSMANRASYNRGANDGNRVSAFEEKPFNLNPERINTFGNQDANQNYTNIGRVSQNRY